MLYHFCYRTIYFRLLKLESAKLLKLHPWHWFDPEKHVPQVNRYHLGACCYGHH